MRLPDPCQTGLSAPPSPTGSRALGSQASPTREQRHEMAKRPILPRAAQGRATQRGAAQAHCTPTPTAVTDGEAHMGRGSRFWVWTPRSPVLYYRAGLPRPGLSPWRCPRCQMREGWLGSGRWGPRSLARGQRSSSHPTPWSRAQPTVSSSLPVLEMSHLQVCPLALSGHSADAAWSTGKVASPWAAQTADL